MTLEELKIAYEDLGKKIAEFEEQGKKKIKVGADYWFIDTRGEICTDYWDGCEHDGLLLECGNIFLSELDAQRELARRKLEVKLIKMGGRKKFKFNTINISYEYNHKTKAFEITRYHKCQNQYQIYFDTQELCQKAINTYKSEILFVMGVTDNE